jgi:hypothetical protein
MSDETSSTDLATQGEGSTALDFSNYSKYKKEVNPEDLATPYLQILQASSKYCQELDDAKAGDIYNSVTGEVTKASIAKQQDGLIFCPVEFVTKYVENIPYSVSKGVDSFINSHDPDSDFVAEAINANEGNAFGKIPCADGKHELVETKYVFGLILTPDGKEVESYAIIPCVTNKLKPLKKWLTSIRTVKVNNAPDFAFRSQIRTVLVPNKEGPDSFTITVTPFGGSNWKNCIADPSTDWGKKILDSGMKMYKAIELGLISVDFKKMSEEEQAQGSAGDSAGSASKKETMPDY